MNWLKAQIGRLIPKGRRFKAITRSTKPHATKAFKQYWLIGALVVLTILVRPTGLAPDAVTVSGDPAEQPINKATYNWQGEPDEPKYINLPTVKAEGFVQKVGVDQNKQIAVPTNIYIAGWFNQSVKPGNKGLSIIDGHVNGRKNDGIFKTLPNVKIGEEFTVELGSGKVLNYKVTKVDTMLTAEAANYLFSQDPKTVSQLNLITCAGEYDKVKKTYEKRVVVAAQLI